jgi:hypothetical protein
MLLISVLPLAFCFISLLESATSQDYCFHHKGATIDHNGYNDIRIWIDPSTPEDTSIIDDIKLLFNSTSSALYSALNNRAYFASIRIVVPSTWSSQSIYSYATPDDLNSQVAEFHVGPPNPIRGDTPFTQNIAAVCGKEGEFVYITAAFLKTSWHQLATNSRMMVQKFAEQRFGVFPEYYDGTSGPDTASNYPFDTSVCLPYADPDPTSCPKFRPGSGGYYRNGHGDHCDPCERTRYTGSTPSWTPPPNCHYFAPDYTQDVDTSLMYTATEPQVTQFCTEDNHNAAAVNLHNARCQRQSVWSVIKGTLDFSPNCNSFGPMPNPPRKIANVSPTFTVVRNNDPKSVAFVLDVSGSMGADSPERINVLNQAVTGAIECMDLDEKVAITKFSSSASTTLQLTKITTGSRAHIEQYVPDNPGGGTALGSGLLQGVQALTSGLAPGSPKGARIIVVSDGAENIRPHAEDPQVQGPLQHAGVTIDTLGISADASGVLTKLANQYGGSAFFVDVGKASWQIALQTSVAQLCETIQPIDQRAAISQVYSATTTNRTGSFFIDSFTGGNSKFLFLSATHRISVVLMGPGIIVDQSNSTCYYSLHNQQMISIRLSAVPAGHWNFTITTISQAESHSHTNASLTDIGDAGNMTTDIQRPVVRPPIGMNDGSAAVAVLVTSAAKDRALILAARTAYSYTQITDITTQHMVVTTSVMAGSSPVTQANVVATIRPPSNCGNTMPNDILLNLKDDGKGADATADDGIYSGYFYDFSAVKQTNTQCRYAGTTKITGDADTSFITKDGTKKATGVFTRSVNNPLFNVNLKTKPSKGSVPPGRVNDLFVNGTSLAGMTISLRWTAPGDDYDIGTAANYSLRYSTNATDLLQDNFLNAAAVTPAMLTRGNLKPQIAGTEQFVEIDGVFETDTTYFFAIVATDEVGTSGPISNLAHAVLKALPTPPTTSTLPTTTSSSPTSILPSTTPKAANTLKSSLGCLGILLAVMRGLQSLNN